MVSKLCVVLVALAVTVAVVAAKGKGQQGAPCKSSEDCDTKNGFFCKITGFGSNPKDRKGHCEVQLDHRGPKGEPKPSNPERPKTPDSPKKPPSVKGGKN